MAITITANLDASGVKTGASQAAGAIDGLASKAENSNDSLDQLAKEMATEFDGLKAKTEALKASLADMGNTGEAALDGIGDGADRAGKSMDGIAPKSSMAGKITAVATSFNAVVVGIKGAFEAAKKFEEAVDFLAENGVEGAKKLGGAIDEIKEKLFDLADDPLNDHIFDFLTGAIEKSTTLAGVYNSLRTDAVSRLSAAFADLGEVTGQWSQGTVAALRELEESQQKHRESAEERKADLAAAAAESEAALKREAAAVEAVADIEKTLAGIEEARHKTAFQGVLDLIDSEEQLRKAIEQETEAIKERAKEGKLSDEERKRSLSKIEAAEARINTIRKTHAAAEKDAAEAVTQAAEQQAAKREQLAQDEFANKARIEAEFAALKDKHAADEVARQGKAHQAAIDLERKAIDDRKRLLGGKDVGGAEQLIGDQNRDQVRKAFAERQAKLATQQTVAENGTEYNAADPAKQKRMEAELSRQRRQALANAQRQFDRGQADPMAIREAQGELANAAVDGAKASGQLSNETAQALRESVGELVRTANEVEQLRGEVNNVRRLIGATEAQGQRRRGQNAGARQ